MSEGNRTLKEYFFSHLSSAHLRRLARIPGSPPFTIICLCVWLIPLGIWLLFSVTYIFTFLYGFLSGHSLPSREIFLYFPGLAAIFAQPTSGIHMPPLAKALLAYAFAGFILSSILQREEQQGLGRRVLTALGKYWNAVSCLIIFSLLFATLGGIFFSYSSDSGYFLFAGILPFSDANAFYTEYTEYFYKGLMGDIALRRPIAAFMGASIYWLAGNDPATALLVQCLLLCFAMWVTCAVMNKSFGVWSAIGCLALEYGYSCLGKYSYTFMTEPLGFFWGAIAAALWVQSLREKRLFWDLAAFSATLIGLLTRMGAMFLVPALFLYILWKRREISPGAGWWKKPLCGLCVCMVAIVLLNATFASRGAVGTHQTGSNFAYTFAGLTLGGYYYTAQKLYQDQLNALPNEKQKSRFLYKQGIKNLLHSPKVFFKRVAKAEWEFLKHFNFFLFFNWGLICLMGALLLIRRKTIFSKSSAMFWVFAWGGILPSIPFIYYDGFSRIFFFAYPLIACFFSLPLAMRQANLVASAGRPRLTPPCLAVSVSCALLLLMMSVALFPRLHTSADIERMQKYKASLPKFPSNRFLIDPRGMGFLVVPDGEEPDTSVPSMTWSTFRDKYRAFAPDVYEDLFTDGFPKPPFVALCQVPVSGPFSRFNCFFIAPPKVLTQKDVLLWDIETASEVSVPKNGIWKIATKAIPILYK